MRSVEINDLISINLQFVPTCYVIKINPCLKEGGETLISANYKFYSKVCHYEEKAQMLNYFGIGIDWLTKFSANQNSRYSSKTFVHRTIVVKLLLLRAV